MKIIATILGAALLGGCASSQTIYDNNGVKLVQVQADPGVITRGFSVLVMEEGGSSTVLKTTPNRSLVESLVMPAALVGAASAAPGVEGSDMTISNNSSSSSKARAKTNNDIF